MLDTALSDIDLFIEFVKRFPMLEALQNGPKNRDRLAKQLGVSTATTYRHTGWLTNRGFVEESDGEFTLTSLGEVVTEELSACEATVRSAKGEFESSTGFLIDLIRYSPMLETLRRDSLDRQDLEQQLDISRSTSHRFTGALDRGELIAKSDGCFSLTPSGEVVADAISIFKTHTRLALHLAPVLGEIFDTVPAFDIAIFSEATVTSADHGNPYSPMTRFLSLLDETGTMRGFDTFSIVPGYMEEYQQCVLDGMETEVIDFPAISEDVMESYPKRCVEVCVSEYFTLWIHNDLLFGLVILDDRIGIGVCDDGARTMRRFIDTDSAAVREWAEALYESYKEEAVRLDRFTKTGLREAMARL